MKTSALLLSSIALPTQSRRGVALGRAGEGVENRGAQCHGIHSQLQSYAVDVMTLPLLRSTLSRTPDAVAVEPVPRRRRKMRLTLRQTEHQ